MKLFIPSSFLLLLQLNLLFPTSALAQITATKTTTVYFNIFDTPIYYGYNWTVNWTQDVDNPMTANAFQVSFVSLPDFSSYSGPGAKQNGAPAGSIQVVTDNPSGFDFPLSFTTYSVYFPSAIEGLQTFTLGNYPSEGPFTPIVNPPIVASLPTVPGNGTIFGGSDQVALAAGTFAPNMQVDLIQDNVLIGTYNISFRWKRHRRVEHPAEHGSTFNRRWNSK